MENETEERMETIMKRTAILFGILALCLTVSAPASAAEKGWNLRVFAAGFDPSLDETELNDDGSEVNITATSDLGFGASIEYQFTNLLGLEVGYQKGTPEIELSTEVEGYGEFSTAAPMSTSVITVEMDFHLTPKSPTIDLYLGAGMAMMSYGNVHFNISELEQTLDLRIQDNTAWTAKAGIDISFGKNSAWGAAASLRYIDAKLKVNNLEESATEFVTFDFGLTNFTVGIVFSF